MGLSGFKSLSSQVGVSRTYPKKDGFDYKLYNGYYGNSPDGVHFTDAAPLRDGFNGVSSGRSFGLTTMDSATQNNMKAGTSGNFTLEWNGFFYTGKNTGTFKFYLGSDDGSYLWIGDTATKGTHTSQNALINNNHVGPFYTFTNTILLQSNIYYPMKILYGQADRGSNFAFSFEKPNDTTRIYNGSGNYFLNGVGDTIIEDILTNKTFILIKTTLVRYMILAGGGGEGGGHQGDGGFYAAGGGGAGGCLLGSISLQAGSYDIVIGDGGIGGTLPGQGVNNGKDSSFAGVIATGGGGGINYSFTANPNGGSGGGAGSGNSLNNYYSGGTGIDGQGFDGGRATKYSQYGHCGGGGGGKAEKGHDSNNINNVSQGEGGAGGDGIIIDGLNLTGYTGSIAVGGGGGGSANQGIGGAGGFGGGGHGISGGDAASITAGLPNTGGGGGGTVKGRGVNSKNGGSGRVILVYVF